MDPRVSEIFTRALELPESERLAFLAQACGGDEELAERVRQMLADAKKADDFFGGPPKGLRFGHPEASPEG